MTPHEEEPRFRIGLRVEDVPAAAAFYAGLGFEEVGSVPDPDGRPTMTILQGNGLLLIVDALEGMPVPDSERERLTKTGPEARASRSACASTIWRRRTPTARKAGSTITTEPMDEAWGDRVFECVVPFGDVWESHIRSKASRSATALLQFARAGSAGRA